MQSLRVFIEELKIYSNGFRPSKSVILIMLVAFVHATPIYQNREQISEQLFLRLSNVTLPSFYPSRIASPASISQGLPCNTKTP